MDSPYSASPDPSTPPVPGIDSVGVGMAVRDERPSTGEIVVVADLGNPIAADYAEFLGRGPRAGAVLVPGGMTGRLAREADRMSLILFLTPRPTAEGRRALADLLKAVQGRDVRFVGIVGSFRIHLDDPECEAAERDALARVREGVPDARVVVLRPGHVLGGRSPVDASLRRLAPFSPLVPGRLHSCFIQGQELFAAIEALRTEAASREDGPSTGAMSRAPRRDGRAYTLLGENASWRELLRRHESPSLGGTIVAAAATALSWLGVGQAAGLALTLLAGRIPRLRAWNVHTLKPRSQGELISLCHPGNIGRVRVVGYNNGVNHFGHRHPGKTVVSTVRCRRTARIGPGRLKADAGATIRDALDCLSASGEDLYVLPNYSYVSLGTALFVPIHGSSVDFATVADTIDRVVFYDPDRDRIVSASRDDAEFAATVYNLKSRAVALRLYLRTKPKAGYFVRREIRTRPTAGELLEALRDRGATNVEVRQGSAASDRVTVSKYYNEPGTAAGTALELPRDALGRLWDRLEENPISSYLMHALSRHVAWHTELFLTPDEFEVFWRTHAKVPLRKIQLRYIRRDGMPHSPFRDGDCVSADLFLFRPDKPAYDEYVRRTIPSVRFNPGKHSN
ncbi:hypothetical protein [Aquisphaera insulae]|uniref:hypothetical protein n=1 Tax=Aquisphaera insulae TaxID=2712864 RepID=UPI0013ED26E7|nr:hypothetical protein [Aquisphaera insulae]